LKINKIMTSEYNLKGLKLHTLKSLLPYHIELPKIIKYETTNSKKIFGIIVGFQ